MSADNEIIDGILSMIDSLPKLEPTKPVIVVTPGFRVGKSFVYEALKMQAQAGLIDLEVIDELPQVKAEDFKVTMDELWQMQAEDTGTLTVEPNRKIKGSHPQPFYRKSRW